MLFKCNMCKQKDREIEYLRKLVDNLLSHKGIVPVAGIAPENIEDDENEKADRALKERGAIRYGD